VIHANTAKHIAADLWIFFAEGSAEVETKPNSCGGRAFSF
jgi:hypothetical protein